MLKPILLSIFILVMSNAQAQRKKDPIEKYLPTDNVNFRKDDNKRKNAPKFNYYRHIIKNKTTNILYGNSCALEATHKMGFEYVVQAPKTPGSTPEFKRLWNNFKVKTRLFFLRSPFWKFILKGKLKKCRIKSGDKVG